MLIAIARYLAGLSVVCCFSLLLLGCSDAPEPQAPNAGVADEHPAQQDKGQFKQGRQWPGMAEGKCGARLMVVNVDGSQTEYWPPADLFQQLEQQVIVQNESPRPASSLSTVLAYHGASRLRISACNGATLSLGSKDLAQWPGLLVLSGRGPLKLVKEEDGEYITMLRMVRKIEFLAGDDPASASTAVVPAQ